MVDTKNQEWKASDGHKKPMVDIKNQECVQEF